MTSTSHHQALALCDDILETLAKMKAAFDEISEATNLIRSDLGITDQVNAEDIGE